MEDSGDEGARSELEGREAERERAAAFALTRSRQPCLRRKSRKLRQEEEPENYGYLFLWFMKTIYFTVDIVRSSKMLNQVVKNSGGPTCICSLTHFVTTPVFFGATLVLLWHT